MEEYEQYDGLGLAALMRQGAVGPGRAHAKGGSSPRHTGYCIQLIIPRHTGGGH
jgi:hypothetical protein